MMRGFLVYKAGKVYRSLVKGDRSADDFNWKLYHHHYAQELRNSKKNQSQVIKPGDYTFTNGSLNLTRNVLPLHPNHRLEYESILQLKPKRVMEVGCGWGDHLQNLSVLNPKIQLFGCDLGNEQLRLLKKRHPHLKASVRQFDITLPFSDDLPKVDVCFTQAVIMHIQTANAHRVGLANMFKMATNQVVLMENWKRHNFLDDIKMLHKQKMIPWKNIYFYYRTSPEYGNKPHIMIVSSKKLRYPELKNYKTLSQ